MIWRYGIIDVFFILPRSNPFYSLPDVRNDYEGTRMGNRVVSCGEHPYFDPNSKSRREALMG